MFITFINEDGSRVAQWLAWMDRGWMNEFGLEVYKVLAFSVASWALLYTVR